MQEPETLDDSAPDIAEGAIRASGGAGDDTSLLDALATQRDELAASREVYIPIPGYEKSGMQMLARYRLVSGEEIAAIGKKVTREYTKRQTYERNLYASIDLMISACTGVFVERDGEKIQLKHNGVEIDGYNQSLAEALKFDGGTSRLVVLGVFGNNIVAVQQHSMLFGRWMSDTSTDVMGELLEGNL